MSKWEYVTKTLDLYDIIIDTLNEFGKNGWELVCVIVLPNEKHKFFFKRPLIEPESGLVEINERTLGM